MTRKFEMIVRSKEEFKVSAEDLQDIIELAFNEYGYPYEVDRVFLKEVAIAKNATAREVNLIEE